LPRGMAKETQHNEPGKCVSITKRENTMKRSSFFAAVAVIGLMAGCSSPEDKANQADADMKAKRMQLADDYQSCTKKSAAYEEAEKAGKGKEIPPEDRMTMAQCDEIMKTMEALK